MGCWLSLVVSIQGGYGLLGGPKRDFADITQRSRSGSKNLGLKIGGRGAGP